jgi:hypothetical protein
MKNKEEFITEEKVINTPAGGVLIGKDKEGQTIIPNDGSLGGFLIGRLHKDGGIKAVNKSTGQPLEMQANEVVITAPAVADTRKRMFEGKMMTNREILSKINSDGGGVSFESGGDIPNEMSYRGSSYNFGGKTMTDYEIMQEISKCGCSHDDDYDYGQEDGKSRGKSLSDIAKMHNVSLAHINQQVDMGLEVEREHTSNFLEQMQIVKDHLYENPDYYTILKTTGLKNGGKIDNLVKDAKNGNNPARDLNNYNDVLDLSADGMVGGENGLAYSNGGSIDDLLNDVEQVFSNGGGVGLPKVAYLKVKQAESSLTSVVGNKYNSYAEFADSIKEAYRNIGKKVRSWIYLEAYGVNDELLITVATNISDQKNTIKNYNPFTGNYKNLEKSLSNNKPISFKKYDWEDWLNSRRISVGAAQTSSNMVDVLRLEFNYNGSLQQRFLRDGKNLLRELKEIESFEKNQSNRGEIEVKVFAEVTDNSGKITAKQQTIYVGRTGLSPSMLSLDELKNACNVWFDNKLDFTNFFEKGITSSTQALSIPKTLTAKELRDTKIWIGDNPELSKAVEEKLVSLGFPFDEINSTSTFNNYEIIFVYNRDFTRLDGSRESFDGSFRKEIFPSELGIDVNNLGGASTASQSSPTAINIPVKTLTREEIKNSKIFMGTNPKLKEAIQRNLFDKGFSWASGSTKPEYLDDDDVQALEILDTKFRNLSIGDFVSNPRREISPSQLGIDVDAILGGSSATASQSSPTATSTASTPKVLRKEDFQRKKIKIYGNKELALKVISKLEELGLSDNEGLLEEIKENDIFGIATSSGEYVGWIETEEKFDVSPNKEVFPSDLGIDVNNLGVAPTTATAPKVLRKEDLYGKKIWVGLNPELSKAIHEKLTSMGLPIDIQFKKDEFIDGEAINIYSNDFAHFDITKNTFDSWFEEEIFPSDLGIDVNNLGVAPTNKKIDDLAESKLKLFLKIKDFVDSKSLTVYPANIETDNPNVVDFADQESGETFKFSERDGGLYPNDDASSKVLFEFFDFQKEFTSFMKKRLYESLNKYLADERKLYTRDFENLEADLTKDKTDLEDLKKLLPSFQDVKFAKEKAMILKEMKRLHEKITNDGFIFTNQLMANSESLFTPQGMLKYYFDQTTQNPTAKLEDACKLPTPNGKESKLPLSAYFNVRTKQFKNWFGDWEMAYETGNYVNCSKMIDEETKEPKIFFHGVRKYVPNFGNFSNMGQGVVRPYGSFEPPTAFPASYFSDNEDYAKFYGGIAPNMPKPSNDYEPFIYKVFLSAKNPLTLIPLGFEASYQDLLDYLLVVYGIKKLPSANVLNRINNNLTGQHPVWVYVRNDISLLETIKEYGYDALIQIGDIPTFDSNGNVESDRSKFIQEEEYLTFSPSQVKSATVLKSFYFDFFKDIRFNKGGYVRL